MAFPYSLFIQSLNLFACSQLLSRSGCEGTPFPTASFNADMLTHRWKLVLLSCHAFGTVMFAAICAVHRCGLCIRSACSVVSSRDCDKLMQQMVLFGLCWEGEACYVGVLLLHGLTKVRVGLLLTRKRWFPCPPPNEGA